MHGLSAARPGPEEIVPPRRSCPPASLKENLMGRMVDIGRYGRDEAGVAIFPRPTLLLDERGRLAWDEQGRAWVL